MNCKNFTAAKKERSLPGLKIFESVGRKAAMRIYSGNWRSAFSRRSQRQSHAGTPINLLDESNLLLSGSTDRIRPILKKFVRFHNKKAEYLVRARALFTKDGRISIKELLTVFLTFMNAGTGW